MVWIVRADVSLQKSHEWCANLCKPYSSLACMSCMSALVRHSVRNLSTVDNLPFGLRNKTGSVLEGNDIWRKLCGLEIWLLPNELWEGAWSGICTRSSSLCLSGWFPQLLDASASLCNCLAFGGIQGRLTILVASPSSFLSCSCSRDYPLVEQTTSSYTDASVLSHAVRHWSAKTSPSVAYLTYSAY